MCIKLDLNITDHIKIQLDIPLKPQIDEASVLPVSSGTSSDLGERRLKMVQDKIREIATPQQSGSSASSHLTPDEFDVLTKSYLEFVTSRCNDPNDDDEFQGNLESWIDGNQLMDIGGQKILNMNAIAGEGSKGDVIRGMTSQGQLCAIKSVDKPVNGAEPAELRFLKLLQECTHVIKLYASDDSRVALEYINKTLSDVLKDCNDPEIKEAAQDFLNEHLESIVTQLLSALIFMHEKGVIHSDLKLENIFLTYGGELRISDFDLSVQQGTKVHGGTEQLYAPEQLRELDREFNQRVPKDQLKNLNRKVDVWQCMLILCKLSIATKKLSPDFQKRFNDYMAVQARSSYDATQEANKKFNGLPMAMKSAKRFTLYIQFAKQNMTLFSYGKTGVFDGLTPTTHLEELLIKMSSFNPAKRISSTDIQQTLEQLKESETKLYDAASESK